MPVSSLVSQGTVKVTLSEVLEVRSGPLDEDELWSVLCQSAKALQDVFLQGEAVSHGTPRFVLCPYTLHFTPNGRVTFAETIDPTLPDIRNFLSPEVLAGHLNPSDVAVEKMLVYSLGTTLFWAAQYVAPSGRKPTLSRDLHAIILAMTNANADSRVALVHILEACTLHARQSHSGLPYAHHVMKLCRIVMGSVFELDKLVHSSSPGDEVDADLNSSYPLNGSTPNDYFFALPYLPYQDVQPFYQNLPPPYCFHDYQPCSCCSPAFCPWRVSPIRTGLHQNVNNNATPGRRPRSARDGSSHHGRSRTAHHPSNISTSTIDSRDSYDGPHELQRVHRTHRTPGVEETGRSYHMSDIFTPTLSSRERSHDRSRERSHDRSHAGSPDRASKKSRSPPSGESRHSQANAVYDRLLERRERLRLLREQLGIRHQDLDIRRPLLGYHSDGGTVSNDGSVVTDGHELRSRARSLKSLMSMESAQEGSFYPDQQQYASSESLSTDRGPSHRSGNHRAEPQGTDHHVPDPQTQPVTSSKPSSRRIVVGAPNNLVERVPVNGQAPQTQNVARDPPAGKRKLKKFFGPEFVVMSSTANESLDMSPSILCKAGKIPPDRKKVTVVLLNGRRLDLMCDLGTKGQEMFDLVTSHMGLGEKVYFGLAYIKDGEYFFLDADTKLFKVGPESWKEEVKKGSKKIIARDKFTLFFRIKFYLENTAMLRDQLTRHQYFLQLRRDILEERTRCDQQAALQLASLALQAEMGDYRADTMGRNYFLPEHYIPSTIIDTAGVPRIRQTLPPMHATHVGMGELQAEMEFLMEARKLQEYGIHFHRASRSKKDPSASIWLGICTRGIIVYEKHGSTRQQIHAHPWHLTRKIAFNRKKFSIEANDGTTSKYIHYTENYKKGRYMLQLCQSQHRFQMAMRLKANTSRKFAQDFPVERTPISNSLQPYNDYEEELQFSDEDENGSLQNSVPESLFLLAQDENNLQNGQNPASLYEEIATARRSRSSSPQRPQKNREPPVYQNQPAFPSQTRNEAEKPRERSPHRERSDNRTEKYHRHLPTNYHSKETIPYRETPPVGRSTSKTSQGRRLSETRSSRLERQNEHLSFRSTSSNDTQTENSHSGVAANHKTPSRDARRSPSRTKTRAPEPNSSITPPRHRDYDEEHPYASVGDLRFPSNHSTEEEDDYLNGREILGLDEVDAPYVIDASIRTHERTRPTTLGDRTDMISETLQDRLDRLSPLEQPERDIAIVTLKKDPEHGLGLNVVGGENSRNLDLGVFVQSVIPGGPADQDGRLKPGDRIISINGQSLEGLSHRVAVTILNNAPPTVQFIVSQARSSSPDSKPRQHIPVEVDEVITPSATSQSESQLPIPSNNDSEPSTPGSQKRKRTPPKKPKRRPQSFNSNYSLGAMSDTSQNSNGSASQASPKPNRAGGLLTAKNARPPKSRLDNKEASTAHGGPRSGPEGQRSRSGSLEDQSDIHFSSNDEDIPTPRSSDLDDLFPDGNNKSSAKPSLIGRGSLAPLANSPQSDVSTSPIDAPDSAVNNLDVTTKTQTEGESKENDLGASQEVDVKGHDELKLGDVYQVNLKKTNGSLGISVTGGVNTSVKHGGVYIKSMVAGGAAETEGRIQIGDRVLLVNSESLEGFTHRQAVESLRRAPEHSTLVIERGVPPARANNLPPTPPVPSPQPTVSEIRETVVTSRVEASSSEVTSPGSAEPGERPSSNASLTNAELETSRDRHPQTPSDTPLTSSPMTQGESDTTPILSSDVASPIEEQITMSQAVPSLMSQPFPPNVSQDSPPCVSQGSPHNVSQNTPPHVSQASSPHVSQASPPHVSQASPPHVSQASPPHVSQASPPHVSQASPPHISDDDEWLQSTSSRDSTVRRLLAYPLEMEEPQDDLDSIQDGHSLLPSDEEAESPQATPNMPTFSATLQDNNHKDTIAGIEAESDIPTSRSESPNQMDQSDLEYASSVLSTREADTLTPTTSLDLRGTPKGGVEKGLWGARKGERFGVHSRSTYDQMSDQWTDNDQDNRYPTLSSEDERSRSPSPDGQSNHDDDFVSDSEGSIMPSPILHDSVAANDTVVSVRSPNTPVIKTSPPTATPTATPTNPTSHGSDTLNSIKSPFASQDNSLPLPSDVSESSRTPTPDLPPLNVSSNSFLKLPDSGPPSPTSSIGSVGALALSLTQTMFSTMGIELPDLPFVTPENCFEVHLTKGKVGLGFSVQGGKGIHNDPRLCLVRIKKVFPGQTAAASGLVEEGDVILTVNDQPVYDMTHSETVAVLRGAPQDVHLLLCRPSEEELDLITLQEDEKILEHKLNSPSPFNPKVTKESQTQDLSPSPLLPTQRDRLSRPPSPTVSLSQSETLSLSLKLAPETFAKDAESLIGRSPMMSRTNSITSLARSMSESMNGDYIEVTLIKPAKGGLGFTVAGGVNSGGCYIKDIIQDPAKSDGRLRKGDKLIKVNYTDMRSMSHFDAVSFLRMTPQEVTIKVLRLGERPLDTPTLIPPPVPTSSPPASPELFPMSGTQSPANSDFVSFVNVDKLPIVRILRNLAGQLGLSLTVDVRGGKSGIFVSDVIDGLPASSEGSIQPGDFIHAINGKSLSGMSLMAARRLLETAPSTVELKLTRNGQPVHPRRRLPTPRSPPNTLPSLMARSGSSQGLLQSLSQPEDMSIEEEMKGVMDSLHLDHGDVSSDKIDETEWEDISESDGEHLDDVDAILASLEAQHGISFTDEIKAADATPKSLLRRNSSQIEKDKSEVSEADSPPIPTQSLTPPLPATIPDSTTQTDIPTPPFSPPPAEVESPVSMAAASIVMESPRRTPSDAEPLDRPNNVTMQSLSIGAKGENETKGQGAKAEGGVIWIELEKPFNGSLGFSLTGAMKGGKTSIFIKTIAPGGVAESDERIQVGDRLLQVNGESLVGMTQNKAIGVLRKSRGVVKLAVSRQLTKSRSTPPAPIQSQEAPVLPDRESPVLPDRESPPVPPLNLPPSDDDDEGGHSQAQSYTESARDAELNDGDLSEFDISTSLHFDSHSFPLGGVSSIAFTPPPPGFRTGYVSGHDTDDDMAAANDLPDDANMTRPDTKRSSQSESNGRLAAVKFGQAVKARGTMIPESDEDSSSWGTDIDIPLSTGRGPTLRATPSTHKNVILSAVSDAELRGMKLVRPVTGGRYAGQALRNLIASLQKQVDKQDAVEEFKTLRIVKATDNCEEAKKPNNRDKNRYRNVLPYDKTRVVIQHAGQSSSYINASHIDVRLGKDTYRYIACQGPLPQTTSDFWQMIWEQRSDVIAMVTLAVENSKVKCDRYWPDSMETPITVAGRYQLRLDTMQTLDHFDIRKISMTDTKTSAVHHVTHLNFTAWTDSGVPTSALPLLRYAKYMRRIHASGPIVVHCSAGIGRTGTLITVDAMMGLIERNEPFKIVDIVKNLRTQRQGMIQTKDQYLFCYKAAIELLKTLV